MFGYVRPAGETEADRAHFAAAYCGLCRALGARYGQAARCLLSYDLAFLAVLLWPPGPLPEPERRRCVAHPIGRQAYYPGNPALALAADYTVILSWHQLADKLSDPGGGKWRYRAGTAAVRRAYGKARAAQPAFDALVRAQLDRLHALERANCPRLDEPADAFAAILSAAAAEASDPRQRRVLAQLLYHLGRWIYLVDADDDLAEDFASGGYNPLIGRFGLTEGRLDGGARSELASTLDHSIHLMAAAYELGDFGPWSGLVRSTVYEGLFSVGGAVLEGTFHAADWPRPPAGRNKEQL